MSAQQTSTTARLHRIDAFRLYAVFAVVCIHTKPFVYLDAKTPATEWAGSLIALATRFAVPLFFIFSGYFFAARIGPGKEEPLTLAARLTRRLLAVFLAWSLVYLVEPAWDKGLFHRGLRGLSDPVLRQLKRLLAHPLDLALHGPRVHLWFLVALMLGLWFLALLYHWGRERFILPLGAAFYLTGLAGGAYAATPIGFRSPVNTRDFVFFSALFLGLGARLNRTGPGRRRWLAPALILAGLALQIVEGWTIWRHGGRPPFRNDYFLGTVPYAAGVALLALRPGESRWEKSIGFLGRLSLGVYVAHIIFIDLFWELEAYFPPLFWQLFFPVLVMATSLALVILLARTRLRFLVA